MSNFDNEFFDKFENIFFFFRWEKLEFYHFLAKYIKYSLNKIRLWNLELENLTCWEFRQIILISIIENSDNIPKEFIFNNIPRKSHASQR